MLDMFKYYKDNKKETKKINGDVYHKNRIYDIEMPRDRQMIAMTICFHIKLPLIQIILHRRGGFRQSIIFLYFSQMDQML